MESVGKKWKKPGKMKKKYKILFTKQAKEELSISRKYYNQCRSGLGAEFTSDIKNSIIIISENPFQFQECFPQIRKANTLRFPFSLFYHIQDSSIKIIAIFHNSRNPDEWKKRTEKSIIKK